MYVEAEAEGFLVLESLRGINFGKLGAKPGKLKSQFLPRLNKDNRDQDFALLIVEIVVTLVKCAFMNQSKDEANYKRILTLVDEVNPWFKLYTHSFSLLHYIILKYFRACLIFQQNIVMMIQVFNVILLFSVCTVDRQLKLNLIFSRVKR